jgi:hypothetical protein
MIDTAHARYVRLYHHLRSAIGSADYGALEAMAAELRTLPRGRERRIACLALHHAAIGRPLRARKDLERLLEEVGEESEELFLRLAEAWESLEDRRREHARRL